MADIGRPAAPSAPQAHPERKAMFTTVERHEPWILTITECLPRPVFRLVRAPAAGGSNLPAQEFEGGGGTPRVIDSLIEERLLVPTQFFGIRSELIDGMNLYPLYSHTPPCEALACRTRAHRLAVCFEDHCPPAWARRSREDPTGRPGLSHRLDDNEQ